MISLQYGKMPTFDDFVNHLQSYKDEEGYPITGQSPEVFIMEIHPSCEDYEAFFNLYNAITLPEQDEIVTELSKNDPEWITVTFITHKSLYDFLNLASQQWNYEPAMELAYKILENLGYSWEQ